MGARQTDWRIAGQAEPGQETAFSLPKPLAARFYVQPGPPQRRAGRTAPEPHSAGRSGTPERDAAFKASSQCSGFVPAIQMIRRVDFPAASQAKKLELCMSFFEPSSSSPKYPCSVATLAAPGSTTMLRIS